MTNNNYYVSTGLIEQIELKTMEYDKDTEVLEIIYHPKHSKDPITLKRGRVNKVNSVEWFLNWMLEEHNNSDYTCLVDNPEDYKHLKKTLVKPTQFPLFDTLDGEYIYESKTI